MSVQHGPHFQMIAQETGRRNQSVDDHLLLRGLRHRFEGHDHRRDVGSVVNLSHLRLVRVQTERFAPAPITQAFHAQPQLQGGPLTAPSVHVGFHRFQQNVFVGAGLTEPHRFLSVVAHQIMRQRLQGRPLFRLQDVRPNVQRGGQRVGGEMSESETHAFAGHPGVGEQLSARLGHHEGSGFHFTWMNQVVVGQEPVVHEIGHELGLQAAVGLHAFGGLPDVDADHRSVQDEAGHGVVEGKGLVQVVTVVWRGQRVSAKVEVIVQRDPQLRHVHGRLNPRHQRLVDVRIDPHDGHQRFRFDNDVSFNLILVEIFLMVQQHPPSRRHGHFLAIAGQRQVQVADLEFGQLEFRISSEAS